jgi:hypothetical protein
VEGLWNHPHRSQWFPGGGGLCLHTILVDPRDPEALMVAISTGGVYGSEDAGATWRASNQGIRAVFLPNPDVEFGQCVHKVGRDAANPDPRGCPRHPGAEGVGSRKVGDGRAALNPDFVEPPTPFLE